MLSEMLRHTQVLAIVGDLAVVANWDGSCFLGKAVELNHEPVSLQVFTGGKGLSTQAKVQFLGQPKQVTYAPCILGHVFRGSGEPLYGGPDLSSEPVASIGGH